MRIALLPLGLLTLAGIAFGQDSSSSGLSSSSSTSASSSSASFTSSSDSATLPATTTVLTSDTSFLGIATSFDVTVTSVLTVTPSTSRGTPSPSLLTTIIPQPTASLVLTPLPKAPDLPLAIRITPAFGVLGALLLLSSLPIAILGASSRWTGIFGPAVYAGALALGCILISGVVLPKLQSLNSSQASPGLQGVIVVGSVILGVLAGAAAWFVQRAVAFGVCGFGGLALGWWIQALRKGGVVPTMAGKWIFYIGMGTVFVLLALHPRVMSHLMRVSTAILGGSAFVLGIDCFVRSGLKEFYMYNLGYASLFPKIEGPFPLTQTEIILLAIMVAVTLIGLALQYRLAILTGRRAKTGQREDKEARSDLDDDEREYKRQSRRADDLEAWETTHGRRRGEHRREESSATTLLNATTPLSGKFSLDGAGYFGAVLPGSGAGSEPTKSDESVTLAGSDLPFTRRDRTKSVQSAGPLPLLDLGSPGIREGLGGLAGKDGDGEGAGEGVGPRKESIEMVKQASEDLRRKQELLDEIQTIRRSIDALRSATPGPVTPPAEDAKDREWHEYLGSRQLYAPPARTTPPINTASSGSGSGSMVDVSPAVAAAVQRRRASAHELDRPPLMHAQTTSWSEMDQSPAHAQTYGARPRSRLSGFAPTPAPAPRPTSELWTTADHVAHAVPSSPGPGQVIGTQQPRRTTLSSPTIPWSAPPPADLDVPAPPQPSGSQQPRTLTVEELNARHRARLSKLQRPVTGAMQEEIELARVKAEWERTKAEERRAWALGERERAQRAALREGRAAARRTSVDLVGAAAAGGAHPAEMGAGGRRQSATVKVSEWQAYQAQVGAGGERERERRRSGDQLGSRRMSGIDHERRRSRSGQLGGGGR